MVEAHGRAKLTTSKKAKAKREDEEETQVLPFEGMP
jgi:hypothetical protein